MLCSAFAGSESRTMTKRNSKPEKAAEKTTPDAPPPLSADEVAATIAQTPPPSEPKPVTPDPVDPADGGPETAAPTSDAEPDPEPSPASATSETTPTARPEFEHVKLGDLDAADPAKATADVDDWHDADVKPDDAGPPPSDLIGNLGLIGGAMTPEFREYLTTAPNRRPLARLDAADEANARTLTSEPPSLDDLEIERRSVAAELKRVSESLQARLVELDSDIAAAKGSRVAVNKARHALIARAPEPIAVELRAARDERLRLEAEHEKAQKAVAQADVYVKQSGKAIADLEARIAERKPETGAVAALERMLTQARDIEVKRVAERERREAERLRAFEAYSEAAIHVGRVEAFAVDTLLAQIRDGR
jgi:hypothetical protein